jgi:hypothetical protein
VGQAVLFSESLPTTGVGGSYIRRPTAANPKRLTAEVRCEDPDPDRSRSVAKMNERGADFSPYAKAEVSIWRERL